MSTESLSSHPTEHPISDLDVLKRVIQEAQVSLQRYLILFILHIIFSFSSKERSTQTSHRGIPIISHTRVRENHALLSRTSSRIYNKYKRKQVKAILFNKFAMDLNTFLFKPFKTKIDHKLCVRTYIQYLSKYGL